MRRHIVIPRREDWAINPAFCRWIFPYRCWGNHLTLLHVIAESGTGKEGNAAALGLEW